MYTCHVTGASAQYMLRMSAQCFLNDCSTESLCMCARVCVCVAIVRCASLARSCVRAFLFLSMAIDCCLTVIVKRRGATYRLQY